MVTRFNIIDQAGALIAHGEIEGDVWRVFGAFTQEYESDTAILQDYAGCAIQTELFKSAPDTQQFSLFSIKEGK